MTYQLSRLRLASVGDRAARFSDVTLDMSTSDVGSLGEPVDSILWLRNGGGKSSLLSLFFALLLPLRKDFMGKTVKRYLEDYVGTGDTSHTIAEWVAQSENSLLPAAAPRLITGAVYEWVDRRRPFDADRDRDKLKGWYYSFFTVPGELDLDRLPLHDEAGQLRKMKDFVALLRDIATTRPQQFSFALTDQRNQWMETLTSRGLDPALFGYQKEMNHSEGGVAELFNFPSTDRFIDFLIDLTVDSAEPDLVASNLRKIIDILGRKPDLLADRDFCVEVAARLDTLAERHEVATAAESEATTTRHAAARLAGAFAATARGRASDATWFTTEEERLRAAALKLDRERKGVNDIANELFRIAALHRHTAAIGVRDEISSAHTDARDEELAWQAVVPLAERTQVDHEAALVRRQMAEEERQTAPLREERDRAAAALKARYVELAAAEAEAGDTELSRAETAAGEAGEEDRRAQANRDRATEAEVRAENLRGKEIEIGEAVEAAVRLGDLPSSEAAPEVVLAETRTTKRTRKDDLETIRRRRSERPAIRGSLSNRRQALARERATKVSEHDRLAAEHSNLRQRADELAAHPRLAELVQLDDGGRLDLWTEAAGIRAALTHAIALAESAIVDTRVDAADDDRALEGLRTDAFLPTTRDAQRAVEAIRMATGKAARPGWDLLRDLVPEPERGRALENPVVAELAAGVVVADAAAEEVRGAIRSQDGWSVAHVSVCTASQLQHALTGARPEWLVVPNDPALFDPTAAEAARADRELRRDAQDRRMTELHEQAAADRALLGDLGTMLKDCPEGHLQGLETGIEECRQAIAGIDEVDADLKEQGEELERQDELDAIAERDIGDELTAVEGRIQRLTALAAQVAELPGVRQAIEQLDDDARKFRRFAGEATRRANDHRRTDREARDRAASHQADRTRYEQENLRISLLDPDRAALGETGEMLPALLSRFSSADEQWRTVVAKSVLAERLNNLLRRAERADVELAGYLEATRTRAAALLDTPDGQDPARRATARDTARRNAEQLQVQLTHAETEVKAAQAELDTNTPRDRARHTQLDTEPATEAEAREQAQEQAARALTMSSQVTALGRDADEAGRSATEANFAAQVFDQRAHRLEDAAVPVAAPQDAQAFSGDSAQADTETERMLDKLVNANAAAASTGQLRDEAVQEVRKLASANRFSMIPSAIKDRFTGDESSVLSARAASRAEEMRVRRQTIEGQLTDLDRDQGIVVVEIAALVQSVLANLDSANRHSKLPGTLGGWANEHFLRIRFTRPVSEEDLRARIDAVVDRIVTEKSKPEGLALLKRCVHEAVAPRGFTVKVLKPNSDLAVEPVDVTRLGKFSGGEKLTVCVALYCTLARLRAINRGQGTSALGGTLVLDNPLGTASHVALLRLQRDVAAAHGVQLVYTTGVEDLGAVGQFPNVLRMRNAPGTLRARRYVVVEDRFDTTADGITSVRVAGDEPTAEPSA
ncbi:hypothetical protein [Kutzneria buriramensis]|uniref:Chromosome segregation ATPase n=1 Tax=Kutzneria buriramensis TaxID=1045776 RepID=A0A3E0GVZ6_9PSEU|nr:hypothetical protein [Kutzneria buriramensis]REH30647.1 hypothetical protein BCF44_1235 [Kutzneria buriramensis]